MGFDVYSGTKENLWISKNSTIIINTLNAYSYYITTKDPVFKSALQSSDILVADGFPVVVATKLLTKQKIQKIAGEDVFFSMLNLLNKTNGTCFFLGSSQETLNRIQKKISKEYPNITVGTYSPPYKKTFSKEENQLMSENANKFNPDVLFVGMTAPKQEKWVFENKNSLKAKTICSIGAVFDFYAETVKRPSEFWIKLKLEWFIRFLKEPKRLFKRYFVYSPLFFIHLLLFLIKTKKHG